MSFAKISGMAFMGDPFDDEECRKCNVLPVCGGGCPQDIMQCKDRNNKTYCSSHKNIFQKCCHTYTNASSKKDKNK